jgi:predicted phage terminase large subunit-like protein
LAKNEKSAGNLSGLARGSAPTKSHKNAPRRHRFSGGKESAENTIRNLAGYNVIGHRPTGDKAVRAEPFAAQVQGGNVLLHAGPWQEDFIAEAESFPNGPHLDQIDAAAMAFNHLTLVDTYDQSYAAFRD